MVALDSYADEWPTGKDVHYDVRIGVCRDSARRTDLDNHAKHVDALIGVLWADDSQIANLRVTRLNPSKTDACMIMDVLPWTGRLVTVNEYRTCFG